MGVNGHYMSLGYANVDAVVALPGAGAWMRPEESHDGLDEGTDDANYPDDSMRIFSQGFRLKRFSLILGKNYEKGCKCQQDS